MKFFYFSIFIICSSLFYADAMHGGEPCAIDKAPYMAILLTVDKDFYYHGPCSAAILSKRWILTAAHCINGPGGVDYKYAEIWIGAYNVDQDDKSLKTPRMIKHNNYSIETRWNNDIGLVELLEPIEFSDTIQPISISKKPPKIGDVLTITGYGSDRDKNLYHLQIGRQEIISRKACRKAYKKALQGNHIIDDKVFCVSSTVVDAGFGDSGSPGVVNGKIVGVAVEANEAPLPNVYVNVAHYYDWIVNVTGINFD